MAALNFTDAATVQWPQPFPMSAGSVLRIAARLRRVGAVSPVVSVGLLCLDESGAALGFHPAQYDAAPISSDVFVETSVDVAHDALPVGTASALLTLASHIAAGLEVDALGADDVSTEVAAGEYASQAATHVLEAQTAAAVATVSRDEAVASASAADGSAAAAASSEIAAAASAGDAAAQAVLAQSAAAAVGAGLSASFVMRAKAGAAAGSVEIVAYDDLDGGAASKVTLTGDEIELDGLGVFSGSAIQSADFSAGVSGWRITQAGAAEFNQLIVRDSIVDGAVSNGGQYAAHVDPVTIGDGVDLGVLSLGAFSQGEFWQIAARLKYRMWGLVDTSAYSAKDGWVYSHAPIYTRPRLQWRTQSAGVWSAWSDLEVFPQATSAIWVEHDAVISKQGIFEGVEIRVLIDHITGGSAPSQQSATYTNIHETSYVARALVR